MIDVGSTNGDHVRNLRLLPLCCLNRGTLLPVLGTVPAVVVVEYLVLAGVSLKLHNEDRLDPRAAAGRAARINGFDAHAFRKEVELAHEGRRK